MKRLKGTIIEQLQAILTWGQIPHIMTTCPVGMYDVTISRVNEYNCKQVEALLKMYEIEFEVQEMEFSYLLPITYYSYKLKNAYETKRITYETEKEKIMTNQEKKVWEIIDQLYEMVDYEPEAITKKINELSTEFKKLPKVIVDDEEVETLKLSFFSTNTSLLGKEFAKQMFLQYMRLWTSEQMIKIAKFEKDTLEELNFTKKEIRKLVK